MHSDDSDMSEIFFALCKTVDTPISLGAWLRFKYSQTELASMALVPRDYTCADRFHIDYSVVSFLSKYKGLTTGIDKEAVALQKFTSSEAVCRETNQRFKRLDSIRNGRLHGILHSAQRKISSLLGPFSMFAIDRRYGWGPGATLEIPRRRACVDTKMCELPITVSRTARSLLRSEIESDLHWSETILGMMPEGAYCLLPSTFIIADESRIETVPKNAKTDRVIAVEPRGNSFLQKGFGSYIRTKLRSVGIDLDDQGRNQALASQAEAMGYATLDLKAASDTISKEVVYHLLPYDWAASLDAVRTRSAVMPSGERIVLEKFSSMGNGFTFELETLIFWALAQSVRDCNKSYGEVAVYGDDIIVPRSFATELCLTLQFCGFEVNDDKSFFDGPFFESCGEHFFHGQNVTPAYQKAIPSSLPELMRLANRLIRLSQRCSTSAFTLHSAFSNAWRACLRLSNEEWRSFAIPLGSEGDDGFLLPSSMFPHHPRSSRGWEGVCCQVLSPLTRSFPANDQALLAWTLRDRHKSVKALTIWDDSPIPYFGEIEIAPRVAKYAVRNRWVIPSGEFDRVWH